MDFSTASQLVGSLGFPIVCCFYLFYSNEKLRQTIDKNTEAIRNLGFLIHEHNLTEDKNNGS